MNRFEANMKLCVVCGDRANGYNFNAITCESCKAFFRRNALRKKVYECNSGNRCEINVITRKFCQKCRLDKCFNLGMNKNLILTDEEKFSIKKKTTKNKQNTLEIYRKFTGINNTPSQDSIENIPLMHFQEKIERFNCTATYHFIRNEPVIYHNKPANYLLKSSVNSIERLLGVNHSSDQSYCEKLLNRFPDRGLTLLEERRLEELNRAFSQERDDSNLEECVQTSDILRLIERSVLRLIKMIKRYESYKCLCLPDQTALMRAGCMQIIILRSIMSYNFEQNSWNNEQNSPVFKMEYLKRSSYPSVYESHKNFMKAWSDEWDQDQTVLNLLSVIILFSHQSLDIIHRHSIAFEHHSHRYLLQRYLESKYSTKVESIDKFHKLMAILRGLHSLSEDSVRWHLESSTKDSSPLLYEIFNFQQ